MEQAKNKSKKYRAFTFTHFKMDEIENIKNIECKYLVFGIEKCPSTQREHLQGYIYFNNPRHLSAICKLFSRVYASKGTTEQNQEYCKKDGIVFEKGTPPRQGDRTDIELLRDSVLENKSDFDLMMDNDLLGSFSKYYKFVDRMRCAIMKEKSERWRTLETTVLYGPAGTGKTRYVYDRYAYKDVYVLGQSQKEIWFDGYVGQDILLIDDFYGWIKWAFFLKLTDGHQVRLNIKGSTGWACWSKVFITSNKHPKEWYPSKGFPWELERRLTYIKYSGTEVGGVIVGPPQTKTEKGLSPNLEIII